MAGGQTEEEARSDRRPAQGLLRPGGPRSQPAPQNRLEQFRAGRIDAPIVVELGLNYGGQHLAGDRQKLANSAVQHPYLVHLSRMPSSRRGATEAVIAEISERPKIAYVHHDLEVKEVSYRHLASADITKERHLPRWATRRCMAHAVGRAMSAHAEFKAQVADVHHRQPTRVVIA